MRSSRLLALVGTAAVATALAVSTGSASSVGARENAAPGTPLFPIAKKHSLRKITLDVSRLAIQRRGTTMQVRLKGLSPHMQVLTTRSKTPRRAVGAWVLPDHWAGALGFQPTLALSYDIAGKRRTHVLRGGVLPKYMSGSNTLQVQFNATPQNHQVLQRMKPSGARNITAVLLPTPAGYGAFTPGSYDPGVKKSKSDMGTDDDTIQSPYMAPAPNANFTVPYIVESGAPSLGPPWGNLLSGTGQVTNACQMYPDPGPASGNVKTTGTIFVYQNSAEVQSALSIGGSVSGGSGRLKASLSAAYSNEKTQSASSFYAVAVVDYSGGRVDMAPNTRPTFYGDYNTSFSSMDAALQFMQQCGDSYPAAYNVGATWISVLEIKTASQSQAQSVSANMKASYGGTSGAANFSADLQTATSSAQIQEKDQCIGPSDCFSVSPKYQTVSSTDMNTALSGFSTNYSAMLAGLPGSCKAGQCVTSVEFHPIANLLPTTSANYMKQAAFGAFGVNQNINAWHSQYQALQTANPSIIYMSPVPSDPQTQTVDNLNAQSGSCNLSNLYNNTGCRQQFENCYDASARVYSYLNAQCLPSASTMNHLKGTPDPFAISGTTERDLAAGN